MTIRINTFGDTDLQDRMRRHATIGMNCFPLTTQVELRRFYRYLKAELGAEIKNKKAGSLILTVHCRTLETLERLWEDYCSGRLDTVAKECFLSDNETAKTKEEMGEQSKDDADIVSLKTTISETEYLGCKTFLTEMSGKLSSRGAIPYLCPG